MFAHKKKKKKKMISQNIAQISFLGNGALCLSPKEGAIDNSKQPKHQPSQSQAKKITHLELFNLGRNKLKYGKKLNIGFF